ncbi:MAG: TIGR04282 family arsenosugar biosynthesis glycosyltransferase [Phycisphaerae bacterium]
MARSPDTIILFAKFPQPGRVKTRLIGALTPEQAAEVYHRLLVLSLDTLRAVANARIILAGAPDAADFSEYIDSRVEFRPQGDGDLGKRLSRGITAAFEAGSPRVIVVGADCPRMESGDLSRAFELLGGHDVVIGPAIDGGYYLLGLRRPAPTLLEGIDWSSDRVLGQTQARAAATGLRVALLETRRDVDTIEDIRSLVDGCSDDNVRLGDFRAYLKVLIEGVSRDD